MVDVLELQHHDAPEGWIHIYRLSTCSASFEDLPPDTIRYVVALSKALLGAKEKSDHLTRTEFNDKIVEALKSQAKLTKPTRGRIPDTDRPVSELTEKAGWKHTTAVSNKLNQQPLLTLGQAVAVVADERKVHESVILKAWKTHGPRHDGLIYYARDYFRLQAIKNDLAARLAKCLKVCGAKSPTVVPVRIPARMTSGVKDQHIKITLTIKRISSDEDANLGEILSKIALWNGEHHSQNVWNETSIEILCLISEILLKKIER